MDWYRDEIDDFCRAFCPYGVMDIERACKLADRMGFSPSDIVDWIDDYADGTDTAVGDIDCVYMVYRELWNKAEDEIFSNILVIDGKELNEAWENMLENYVQIFSNYLDSSIYIINGEEEAFIKIATEYIKNYSGTIPQFMHVFFDEIEIDIDEIQGISNEPAQSEISKNTADYIDRKSTDAGGV